MDGTANIKYEYEAHRPVKYKRIPWPVCACCGLVYLNNDITRWCIKMGCNAEWHPQYKSRIRAGQ